MPAPPPCDAGMPLKRKYSPRGNNTSAVDGLGEVYVTGSDEDKAVIFVHDAFGCDHKQVRLAYEAAARKRGA
jgi:hypothetical protein